MSILVKPPILLAPEIREGLAEGHAVVCLESAVVTHGLPEPYNAQAVWRTARIVRNTNAMLGTVGIIEGKIKIGLTDDELRYLGDSSAPKEKIGVRDLAIAVAKRWTGGTTLSATAWIASRVGVRVVLTGGIGGVHRHPYRDESADLVVLSQAPVAVVCAGPKAICDLESTMERLESLCIPVVGVRTKEMPGFFYNDTGIHLDQYVEDEADAARVFLAHRALERKGGILFLSRVPESEALNKAQVEGVITEANLKAEREGVRSKAVTPYLLKAVREKIGKPALDVNLAILESNAAVAATIAHHLCGELPIRPSFKEGA